jgi:hypothetical protein
VLLAVGCSAWLDSRPGCGHGPFQQVGEVQLEPVGHSNRAGQANVAPGSQAEQQTQ